MVTSGTETIVAGTTEILVAHTYGSIAYIPILTPSDDLAGRGYWYSDIGVATFKINISSMDLSDHVFGWLLVASPVTPSPPTDHYCTVAEAKEVMRITTTDVSHDTEILNCIISVDEDLKTELRNAGITAPASASTTEYPSLNNASKHLSAYSFKMRGVNTEKDIAINNARYFIPGRAAMEKHKREYGEIPFLVGEDTN